ncbi:CbtB-domain containing protein [Sneathiella chungangensis]|uniref:CbtB-domain containing protein n=1 Tax=Sneathiella chungangensis TaxID=1418234 RepID=A0A845MM01_9PROT|nr:CbtB domain-containing protein [Sneathiella chungangensis]MZR24027.1 CbtB-domain containing protein [Sneathiella chungangensis]
MISASTSRVSVQSNARTIALTMFILGAGLVFLTGFAPSTTLHNAAHDSRHTLSFPCH